MIGHGSLSLDGKRGAPPFFNFCFFSSVGLSVGGMGVSDNPPPNTTILIPGIGSVTLNEQTCDGGGAPPCSGSTSSGIRVRAIHLIVDNPNALGLPQGADVIVGEAHADSFHP